MIHLVFDRDQSDALVGGIHADEDLIAQTSRSIVVTKSDSANPLPPHGTCAAGHYVAESAQQRLRDCPYTQLRRVQCRFHEGVLVLSGELPTFYLKQIAQTLVHGLDQVDVIDNRIRVSM